VLPFADAIPWKEIGRIPWKEIGVFVEEKDVPKQDTILTSMSIDDILRKQRLLACKSIDEAGHAVPAASPTKGCIPPNLERACSQAPSPREHVLATWRQASQLDCWTLRRSETLIAKSHLPLG
jgi:hypothetical protein